MAFSETVLIRRSNRGSVTNGVPDDGEVYITGPHRFDNVDVEIFSSTKLVAEASRFDEGEANALIAQGKWQTNGPHLVPVEEAKDLT